MRKKFIDNMKNLFLPCIGFSVVAGFLSAVIITVFKLIAELVIQLSVTVYGVVRVTPALIPLLVLGTAAIGLIASFIYPLSRSSRGGGIPSSVAAIRGILNFRWWACIIILPFSALMSFFCGLPLGTEGPCVQLGTAVGDGIIKCIAPKKHKGWRRYIMTGGASAGFSLATSSPVTAIIFAMEELHRHFSPLLMMVASISVMVAQVTVQLFSLLGIGASGLFHIPQIAELTPKLLFVPFVVGVGCGVGSLLFTKLYQCINRVIHALVKKISVKVLFPLLFASVSVIGLFIADTLGTGHSLTEKLFDTHIVWSFLVLVFLIRAVFMIASNTAGVTGGIFLPTISFGAILGALCGEVMVFLGWINKEYYILVVVLGIVAFLGATSHIPITACVFAIEALGGYSNVVAVIIAVTVSFLITGILGGEDFTDAVIESRVRSVKKGKTATVIDVSLTAEKNAFVIGKEIRDILWPNACFVVSIERPPENRGRHEILEGDVITVHYKTYDPSATAEELMILMGQQSDEVKKIMNYA